MLAVGWAAGVYGAAVTSGDAENAVRGWARLCEALDGVYGGEVSVVREYPGKEGVGKFYRARGSDPSVYVLLYMLDCATAVTCVVMGLEATEDGKAAVREGGDKNAEGMATLPL